MRNAIYFDKTLIYFPSRHAMAVARRERVTRATVNGEMIFVRLNVLLDKITDAITQQRHIIISQSRDDQFAHAARVGVHDFQKRRVVARLHFAALVFHEQMAGLRRAVEIEDWHAKNSRQNFFM